MKRTLQHIISGIAVVALVLGSSPVSAATVSELQGAAASGIDYLADQQDSTGAISGLFGAETDWAVVAVAASGQDPDTIQTEDGVSLIDALAADPLNETTPATTIERRVIALNAAGLDSADFDGIDYNALLAAQHNNQQIGDPTLLNDDSFGLIAITASGDITLAPIAQDALDYLISYQGIDGGFSYTTDDCAWCGSDSNDTAASIVALQAASELGLTHDALPDSLDEALQYLLGLQLDNGGFLYDPFSIEPDASSTTWSLMALNTFAGLYEAEKAAAHAWLLQNQNADGGFDYAAWGMTDSNTADTSHAVIALLGMTWLLKPVPLTSEPAESRTVVVSPQEFTPIERSIPETADQPVTVFSSAAVVAAALDMPQPLKSPAAETAGIQTVNESAVSDDAPIEALRYVGFGLIVLSLAGGLGYWVYRRRQSRP